MGFRQDISNEVLGFCRVSFGWRSLVNSALAARQTTGFILLYWSLRMVVILGRRRLSVLPKSAAPTKHPNTIREMISVFIGRACWFLIIIFCGNESPMPRLSLH